MSSETCRWHFAGLSNCNRDGAKVGNMDLGRDESSLWCFRDKNKKHLQTECENGTELRRRQNLLEPSSPSFPSILVSLFNFLWKLFQSAVRTPRWSAFFVFFLYSFIQIQIKSCQKLLSYLSVDFLCSSVRVLSLTLTPKLLRTAACQCDALIFIPVQIEQLLMTFSRAPLTHFPSAEMSAALIFGSLNDTLTAFTTHSCQLTFQLF